MIASSAPAFPAKGLAVPVLRPLVSILRILREHSRTTSGSRRNVLARELSRRAEHLAGTLEHLARLACIGDETLPMLVDRIRALAAQGVDPRDPTGPGRTLEEVVAYARSHHEEFRAVTTEQPGLFQLAYWENVERMCVLLLHGTGAETEADRVARSLLDGCYVHVERHRLDDRQPPLPHHLRVLYATDPEELRRAVPAWQPDVVLCDVGSPRRGYAARLGRQTTRLDRTRTTVLLRPFSALRLLGAIEEARLRQLLEARAEPEAEAEIRTTA